VKLLPVSPAVPNAPQTGLSAWAVAAITAIVLALSALAYQTWINQQTRSNCQQKTEEVQQKLNFLLNQGTIPIALKGTGSHPDALVTIFWNAEQGKTLLEVKNLPALPDELQYQLWSLKDGKPKSAGVLTSAKTSELQSMLNVEEADTFAITIEQKGGVDSPTLNQMVVIGKV
jgi:anti-sigma-K factor RskA